MNIDEFDSQYREAIDDINNQLQTLILLVAQAENKIVEVGTSVQGLSQTVEEFIAEQRGE